MTDIWSQDFYSNSPLFTDIASLACYFNQFDLWPLIKDYNQFLNHTQPELLNGNDIALRFVPQGNKPVRYQDQYEPRIFLKGEIQTRTRNWHDFFQVLIWNRYPQSKSLINALHAWAISARLNHSSPVKQRSAVENTLTLFDECGAIIVSSNPELLELISSFRWTELFVKHRNCFKTEIDCFIFGHALYEKSLSPYIGMTAHAILIEVDEGFFTQNHESQLKLIDITGMKFFTSQEKIDTHILHPFPLLGVPGWDTRNESADFYDNKDYFRPGKRQGSSG